MHVSQVCPRAFDPSRRPGEAAGPVEYSKLMTMTFPTSTVLPAPARPTTSSRASPSPRPSTSSAIVRTSRSSQSLSSSAVALISTSTSTGPAEALSEVISTIATTADRTAANTQSFDTVVSASDAPMPVSPQADASHSSLASGLDDPSASSAATTVGRSTLAVGGTRQKPQESTLPGPLDPSSPGQVSKLSSGTIAGTVLGMLAIIALFALFWYRSYKHRDRMARGSCQVSSSTHTHTHLDEDPSDAKRWTEFGGAKGSMISNHDETASEHDAPIYSKFASTRRAVPSSTMLPSMYRSQSVSTAGIAPSRNLSRNTFRRSTIGMLSSMTNRWTDASPCTPPPSYPMPPANVSSSPAPTYKRHAGTSFFARLLGSPVERPKAPSVHAAPQPPHPHPASQPCRGPQRQLDSLPEERPSQGDDGEVGSHERNRGQVGHEEHTRKSDMSQPSRDLPCALDKSTTSSRSGASFSRQSAALSDRKSVV